MSFPIICATAGRPVGLWVMDWRIHFSGRESACTRKYSVKYTSGPPRAAISRQNARSVTSCIGASAKSGSPLGGAAKGEATAVLVGGGSTKEELPSMDVA